MEFSLEFLHQMSVQGAFVFIAATILLDAVLGALTTLKKGQEDFDLKKLPRFIATNIFPYIGGLFLLAVMAEFVGEIYVPMFYGSALVVAGKFIVEIKDKIVVLFS